MGFIGSFLVPDYGINEQEDRLNCYYIIDEIIFNSNLEEYNQINIIIRLNIYPTIQDRNDRVNLLGSEEYEKTINRSDFNGNILENYYIYCKPLIIENKKLILKHKLGLDITDEIPSEYSEYSSLTDHL